jgi:hypothetical protein
MFYELCDDVVGTLRFSKDTIAEKDVKSAVPDAAFCIPFF